MNELSIKINFKTAKDKKINKVKTDQTFQFIYTTK